MTKKSDAYIVSSYDSDCDMLVHGAFSTKRGACDMIMAMGNGYFEDYIFECESWGEMTLKQHLSLYLESEEDSVHLYGCSEYNDILIIEHVIIDGM